MKPTTRLGGSQPTSQFLTQEWRRPLAVTVATCSRGVTTWLHGARDFGYRGRGAGDVALLGRRPGMLALPVSAQIDLPLERLVAQATRERLVAGVLAQVRDQVGRLAERLAAHHALVRFLACTDQKKKKKRKK